MWTPEVAALLAHGPQAFRRAVVERLLREHEAEVLNPCPRCGAMARTPRAKQCSRCFHDWHAGQNNAVADETLKK